VALAVSLSALLARATSVPCTAADGTDLSALHAGRDTGAWVAAGAGPDAGRKFLFDICQTVPQCGQSHDAAFCEIGPAPDSAGSGSGRGGMDGSGMGGMGGSGAWQQQQQQQQSQQQQHPMRGGNRSPIAGGALEAVVVGLAAQQTIRALAATTGPGTYPPNMGFEFTYRGGDGGSSGTVSVRCDPDAWIPQWGPVARGGGGGGTMRGSASAPGAFVVSGTWARVCEFAPPPPLPTPVQAPCTGPDGRDLSFLRAPGISGYGVSGEDPATGDQWYAQFAICAALMGMCPDESTVCVDGGGDTDAPFGFLPTQNITAIGGGTAGFNVDYAVPAGRKRSRIVISCDAAAPRTPGSFALTVVSDYQMLISGTSSGVC
jgi:hypothetical protein